MQLTIATRRSAWLSSGLILVFSGQYHHLFLMEYSNLVFRRWGVFARRFLWSYVLLNAVNTQRGGGGGVLPYKRLMGCAAGCGRIFTTGLTIMGSHIFEFLGIRHLFSIYVRLANVPECLHCRRKVKCSLFNLKHGSIHKNRKWLSWDRENYIFAQRCRGWGLQLATEYRLL